MERLRCRFKPKTKTHTDMQTGFGLKKKRFFHLPDSRWAKQNSPNKAPPSHTPSGSLSTHIQNLSVCCENNAHHSWSANWFHHHSLAERWQNRCCHGLPDNADGVTHQSVLMKREWKFSSIDSKL